MIDLWQMMGDLYGSKFASNYGDEPDIDGVWAAALIDVPWEKIKYGFDQLMVTGSSWPPSVPEFRKICLGIEEGVNVARAPTVEATAKQHLRGIEHKRSEEEVSKLSALIGKLRGELK